MAPKTVMILCPTTGKPTPVGIAADEAEFEASTTNGIVSGCSQCHENHSWSKDDAFLADEDA